jgi:hypothetical protein
MRLRPLVFAFCAATAASPAAWAQMQLTSSGPSISLESMSAGAGRSLSTRGIASGLKLGDEAILHAGVFADIGYDSNVFYGDTGQQTSAVLHVTPRLELTNAERDGSVPGGAYYDLSAALDRVQYLSSNDDITKQDAWNPTIAGNAEFSSGQALSLSLTDTFSRYQQAPYLASGEPITTNDNMASASLNFAPGGGRLRVMLRYTNLINKYQGAYDVGSDMGNEGVLDVGWRWLPRTTLYAQVAQGAITYFNANAQPGSYPLRTLLGLRGLLTEKLAVNVAAGYSNAFYTRGPNPSGLGNVGVLAEVNYTMSLLSRAGLGYHHDFVNSPFVGGYYNMDAIYGAFQQMVASRVVTYLFGRFENRRFGAVPGEDKSRVDNFVMGGVALDYMIGKFLQAGASYSLNLNRTATASTGVVNGTPTTSELNYTKHVLLFRLGLMY